jgi:hypothetical protein
LPTKTIELKIRTMNTRSDKAEIGINLEGSEEGDLVCVGQKKASPGYLLKKRKVDVVIDAEDPLALSLKRQKEISKHRQTQQVVSSPPMQQTTDEVSSTICRISSLPSEIISVQAMENSCKFALGLERIFSQTVLVHRSLICYGQREETLEGCLPKKMATSKRMAEAERTDTSRRGEF